MENRGDLVINGFGSSNGGEFSKVSINGKGTVNNDVHCVEFDCNGSGTVQGNVIATNTAKINGMAKITGRLDSEHLDVNGTAKIEQNLTVGMLKVDGNVSVGGRVKAEEIVIKGRLAVEGDCEAEVFKAESQFKISGLLNADQIDVKLFATCRAKEIGGQSIKIIRQKASLFDLFKSFSKLETECIEGDTIEIEYTNAKVVRGNFVYIGADSNVGYVEYSGDLKVDQSAVVGESKKV